MYMKQKTCEHGRYSIALYAFLMGASVQSLAVRADCHAPEITQMRKLHDRVLEYRMQSPALQAEAAFAVVLPATYSADSGSYPVVYLLHGAGRTHLTLTDFEATRQTLLDAPFVTVMPRGENGWWIDSAEDGESRYETLVTETIAAAEGVLNIATSATMRGITGWSMGGFGAARYASRHSSAFASVATILGLLDFPNTRLPEGQNHDVPNVFGPTPSLQESFNPMREVEKLLGLQILTLTADRAFDYTMNRNFHRRLLELGKRHEYVVLEGKHTFESVEAALPHVVRFFSRTLGQVKAHRDEKCALERDIESFSVCPVRLEAGESFEIELVSETRACGEWRLRHPYTIPEEEVLSGFHFDVQQQQAFYGKHGKVIDNGGDDLDPRRGVLRVRLRTDGWPAGIHAFTIESVRPPSDSQPSSRSVYRDFAVKIRDGRDRLRITLESDRRFMEGTHFSRLFVTSTGRVICNGKYSDDKGHTWKECGGGTVASDRSAQRSAIMAHEISTGEVIGLAYKTLPKEDEKGVFIGQRFTSVDGGKRIESPADCTFRVPRAVGALGHAFHPGPLFMRSIVSLQDASLLALMCGWFDTDTKETLHKGQKYRRSFLCRSVDAGRSWDYLSTVAYEPTWGSEGWSEGTLLRLPGGELIAALRSGSDRSHWKDNPLCLLFSQDEGRTWSPPHRSGIDGVYPSMVRMSNGLLACSYGRPGAKLMFSADSGRTWTDQTLVSAERYSGYTWIAEVAPGELLYGYGLKDGLDAKTGRRENMLRLVNVHVER